jgi:ATP-binding cassette, subfamily B, multidrug efflux pump
MSYRWVWSFINKYKWKLYVALTIVVICSSMNMVSPYLSGVIVDEVIQKGRTGILIQLIVTIVGITCIRSLLRYTFQLIFEQVSQNTIYDIRKEIYDNLQKLDFGFYDKTRTGDIMARMTGDVDAVRHFTAWVIYMIFENSLIFIFGIGLMLWINVRFTLILVILTPPLAYFARKLTLDVKPAFSGIRIQFSRLNSVVQENISGNRVVKAFAKEAYEIEKFDKENIKFKEKNLRAAGVWGKYLPILDSLSGTFNIVTILIGGFWVIQNRLTLGELVTFNSLIYTVTNPLRMAGWLINDTQRFSASAEKLIELWKAESKIKSKTIAAGKEAVHGIICFNKVSFSYDGQTQILKELNLIVKPGETVGIIGPTGSGKSTLISLLCRFYDCTEGSITINGVDLRDMELKALRKNIALSMQDIFLFSDTIEGNIAYGSPEASFEEVKKAAELAGAHDFIIKFPEGYDTIVGERGVGLSGGQRQRIALARALLNNPSVLILDDTTSAVDMETEHAIQEALSRYNKNKTTFIIAHRISSVKNADKIIVLDGGRIVEQGNHQELISKKKYYYDVYMNQLGNFNEAVNRQVV